MTALLEASDLSKRWGGVVALEGFGFALHEGEMLALIGPNGAGKSTCFGVLGGQVRADRGTLRVDGRAVSFHSPLDAFRAGLGRTFQVARGFASLGVGESARACLLAAGREADGHAVAALLEPLGLGARAGVQVAALAYGEAKRLDLALALAASPRVLLMDEPTAGLSAEERVGLMRLVLGLVRERRIGCLFTEHAMDAVFGFADRVMVLDRGRKVAEGTPDEVRCSVAARSAYLGDAQADTAP